MENVYLRTWFANFPGLSGKLTAEETKVLSTISPQQYVDFNLTRDEEVINIIRDHMPQAWKWISLYPELKNLPPEDYAILDHIVPGQFIFDVTVEDLERIIKSRKEKIRKDVELEKSEKRKRYYEEHKKEILAEDKMRKRLSIVSTTALFIGTSFMSTGIASRINGTDGKAISVAGCIIALVPYTLSTIALKIIDKNSVEPKPIFVKSDKMDFISSALVGCFYLGLIGLSITLGTVFTYDRLGWYVAQSQLTIGLCTAGLSVLLFLLLAIISPTRKD